MPTCPGFTYVVLVSAKMSRAMAPIPMPIMRSSDVPVVRSLSMEGSSPRGALVDDSLHCLAKALGADALAALEPDELLLGVRAVNRTHELRLALDALAIPVLLGSKAE